MAENTLWAYLKKGMAPFWSHARRHEDSIATGTSDVSYYHKGNSWIELKEVKALPKRAKTGISLGQWHENNGAQRHFLIKRKGFLLIRFNDAPRCYMIYNHKLLPPWEKDRRWNFKQFTDNAAFVFYNRIDFAVLSGILVDPE